MRGSLCFWIPVLAATWSKPVPSEESVIHSETKHTRVVDGQK